MNRAARARLGAVAIAPVTISGIFLIRCNCSGAAYGILTLTATIFGLWVLSAKEGR